MSFPAASAPSADPSGPRPGAGPDESCGHPGDPGADRHDGPGRPQGLRERKKLATRRALGEAAMRLAIERGLENVLVEDIAAAAEVSPRTFNNYFASKYEAISALAVDRSFRIGEELRARPAAESLWDAVRGAVLTVYQAGSRAPDPQRIEMIRLVASSPALRGEYLKALSIMQYELAGAIAERMGDSLATASFFARGLAGAVITVVQAATERWLLSDRPQPLVPLVEQALAELAAGMAGILPENPVLPAPGSR
jgi:AcrR family transcriptional regulator